MNRRKQAPLIALKIDQKERKIDTQTVLRHTHNATTKGVDKFSKTLASIAKLASS
jgi:hypothetical protein